MSQIERYLDELFDRLAGTGGAGRRALAEAEDHLRAATADALARGLPTGQAEDEAVSRFGSPAMVARKLRSAYGAGRLNRALSAGWLAASLAACGLGIAYLAAAGRVGWRSPACASILSHVCFVIAGPLTRYVSCAVIAAAVGAALLLGRWLAVQYAGLAPVRRGFVAVAGLMLIPAAALIGMAGWMPELRVIWPVGAGDFVILRVTVLIECLAAAVSLADSRRPRHLPQSHGKPSGP